MAASRSLRHTPCHPADRPRHAGPRRVGGRMGTAARRRAKGGERSRISHSALLAGRLTGARPRGPAFCAPAGGTGAFCAGLEQRPRRRAARGAFVRQGRRLHRGPDKIRRQRSGALSARLVAGSGTRHLRRERRPGKSPRPFAGAGAGAISQALVHARGFRAGGRGGGDVVPQSWWPAGTHRRNARLAPPARGQSGSRAALDAGMAQARPWCRRARAGRGTPPGIPGPRIRSPRRSPQRRRAL